MAKSEKTVFWIVTTLMLLLLVIIVWRNTTRNEAARVYRVSMITDDAQGDYTQNIRKGLDRAARDYNIDLQIIPLQAGMRLQEQESFLMREMESGVDAIVLNLQQHPDQVGRADISGTKLPIISLGATWRGSAVASTVSTDDEAMGRMLAQEMLQDGATVCFIRASFINDRIRLREKGLRTVLEEAGVHCSVQNDATAPEWIDIPADAFVAALDEPSLERLVQYMPSSGMKLYGIGCTNELLYHLEMGVIERLIVEDGYAMGYLAIQSAVQAIEGGSAEPEHMLKSYIADAEHLYEEPLQHVLFPIS